MSTRHPDYAIDPQFIKRWSPRSYKNQSVSDETLMTVLEAARWAPSGSNEQPWRFVIAKTPEDLSKFHGFLAAGNAAWAHKAPVLILLVSKTVTSSGRKSVSHSFDSGAAWAYLALEASRLGLITHAMGGFDRAKAREAVQLPEDYHPEVVIALGYQADPLELPEELREREVPSGRRPLGESVYEGTFKA